VAAVHRPKANPNPKMNFTSTSLNEIHMVRRKRGD